MKNTLACLFVLFLSASALTAGSPREVNDKCPNGFGRAKYTSTFSCSSRAEEIYLNGSRPNSCEFVTQLPICSKHSLPYYTSFDKGDGKLLRSLVKTHEYTELLKRSRFERAHFVETTLQRAGGSSLFWLLQEGYWYDTKNTFGDEVYFKKYQKQAQTYFESAQADEKPWIMLLAAYVRAKNGDPERAKKNLKWARSNAGSAKEAINLYANKLQSCFGRFESESCSARTVVKLTK